MNESCVSSGLYKRNFQDKELKRNYNDLDVVPKISNTISRIHLNGMK